VQNQDSRQPSPCRPIPSPRQLAWHKLEFYGFIHFSINTFTDREWGYGDEHPDWFNPTELNADQWAETASEAGMKGLILTCKHHDGFCLWPSRYTEHSVKNSPWKNGRGDLVREVSDACRRQGLLFGIYLSPWDRNHPRYGFPEYITYYRNQLEELLTEYGPIFEVWFDGANGGDGYYGGARETRQIDASSYYDWPGTWDLVRQLQPHACIFSDTGPDIRWVGNESGTAGDPAWYTFDTEGRYPGYNPPGYDPAEDLGRGHIHGQEWVPPEVDVSIRPGWFYHRSEDCKVKNLQQLLKIYYRSIGRGANLLLNVPPDPRGLIHERDAEVLRQFRRTLDAVYSSDLAYRSTATASSTAADHYPRNICDPSPDRFWMPKQSCGEHWLQLSFPSPAAAQQIVIGEYIALGQRIRQWKVDIKENGRWLPLTAGTSIGRKRIIPLQSTRTVDAVRLRIEESRDLPLVSRIAVY